MSHAKQLQPELQQWASPEQVRADMASLGADGYESLGMVLRLAFLQAAFGKGDERHAQDQPFDEQPMQKLIDLYGPGFALGQAAKKMQEAQRLPHDMAVKELLGAINYAAGAIIALERAQPDAPAVPVAANDNVPGRVIVCCQGSPDLMCDSDCPRSPRFGHLRNRDAKYREVKCCGKDPHSCEGCINRG